MLDNKNTELQESNCHISGLIHAFPYNVEHSGLILVFKLYKLLTFKCQVNERIIDTRRDLLYLHQTRVQSTIDSWTPETNKSQKG